MLIAILGGARGPAAALETDQFFAWGRQLADSTDALNARVYALFSLTPAEVALIEESTKYRYGEV